MSNEPQPKRLDETVAGGAYRLNDGRVVNANGEPVAIPKPESTRQAEKDSSAPKEADAPTDATDKGAGKEAAANAKAKDGK